MKKNAGEGVSRSICECICGKAISESVSMASVSESASVQVI